jgi:hypothetical protein
VLRLNAAWLKFAVAASAIVLLTFVGHAVILGAQEVPANTWTAARSSVSVEHRVMGFDAQTASLPVLASSEVPIYPQSAGAGLLIQATFDPSVDAATQAVINNAINFYQNTFTNPITVNIYFYAMGSGLGESWTTHYYGPYSDVRNALASTAKSTDDATALANTPAGASNPVSGDPNIIFSSANGRAIGLQTPGSTHPGSPCPTFTGDGCIGLNVALANQYGGLTAVIEHEIDEVLGLGSSLSGVTTPAMPWMEDLFRWASAGSRSYTANPSTSVPCVAGTPRAFFSIDGGVTAANEFNNCANGGDYGDWVTHTPSQVQDAFTNFSGAASLTATSSEARALDVIGYNIVAPSSSVVAHAFSGDFNGDGKFDILWRHTSGTVYEWLLNGTSIAGQGSPSSASTDWSIAGIGDFNGDGKSDILWRHTSGTVYVWLLNGTTVIAQGSPGSATTDWSIAGVGDFNGDGKADILWRHSSGTVYEWLLNGTTLVGQGSPGSATTDWTIAGVGDFNGDGKADVLWRNANGMVYEWLLSGTTLVGQGSPGSATTDWSIAGARDLNGDGKADILWRNANGMVYEWLMSGTTIVGQGSPGSASTDWSIAGVADYNGDGKNDILWRHSSGTVYEWLLNGTTIIGQGSPGSASTDWLIQ